MTTPSNTSDISVTSTSVARVESVVQVVILLFMGGMAGAASFVHIHDVTARHGQPSWIGWANAVVIELMSIVAGLDIRRRKRAGHSTGSVVVVLLVAVGISLAAQVATAQPSVWGWVVAALPALGLLAVVKIVLSRTAAITGPDHDRTPHTGQPGPADRSGDQVTDRPVDHDPGCVRPQVTSPLPVTRSRETTPPGPSRSCSRPLTLRNQYDPSGPPTPVDQDRVPGRGPDRAPT